MRVLWTHNFNPAIPGKGSFLLAAAEGLRSRGIDLHMEYLGDLRSAAQILRARTHVKQLAKKFDLVHAQYGSACALVTAVVQVIPKVLTIRGNDWSTYNGSLGFLYLHTRLATAFTRLALKSFDYVFTVSHRTAGQVSRMAPNVVITVLPSPIDLSLFVPRNRMEAKALLGYPSCNEKWVLFNSLDLENPVKRFAMAKQAFELAQKRHGNLRLRLATKLAHDEMANFVAACDLILCTSESEGWPNSVKEALACDVPFVATDVSDLRDIAANEPSCRICPPDATVIAANICEVLALPEPLSLRQYVSGMSVDASADRMIAIYKHAIAGFCMQGRTAKASRKSNPLT